MRKLFVGLVVLIVVGACTTGTKPVKEHIKPEKKPEAMHFTTMKVLPIKWQRLVAGEVQTCERCESTGKEIAKAFQSLKESLVHLGIEVTLEEKALDPAVVGHDMLQSNRIWIGERSLEEWLGAQVGKSRCGFCCEALGEDVECRTIEVEGKTYETIPADFIVRAGLQAASQLFVDRPLEPLCGFDESAGTSADACCPITDAPPAHKEQSE